MATALHRCTFRFAQLVVSSLGALRSVQAPNAKRHPKGETAGRFRSSLRCWAPFGALSRFCALFGSFQTTCSPFGQNRLRSRRNVEMEGVIALHRNFSSKRLLSCNSQISTTPEEHEKTAQARCRTPSMTQHTLHMLCSTAERSVGSQGELTSLSFFFPLLPMWIQYEVMTSTLTR